MPGEHLDVLIVGAGLSGICAAHHLRTACPGRTFALLERRERIGGTWDLFRYPGIRSDSDMYTLGYSFRPWREPRAIADGPSILRYVEDTAREDDTLRHIRFGLHVRRASWSSAQGRWTVEAEEEASGRPIRLSCGFLFMCSGYYDYDSGYVPDFAGRESFRGRIVHPQQWTKDVTYAGRRVVVIGSGATAVTLVPELAREAAHVVMLQRSPTYIVSAPAADRVANALRRWLPEKMAYGMSRWQRILFGALMFRLARRDPARAKARLIDLTRTELGPEIDVEKHFTPSYNPWEQRLCLAPDGDFFAAIRTGRASVVTDQIECFTEKGIRLASGEELEADLIVTATGLRMKALGGLALVVDGQPVQVADTLTYKGVMFSGVPNLALAMGYTNASWTLKCDLTAAWVCRLLNHMTKRGLDQCRPTPSTPVTELEPFFDFSSGYIRRGIGLFPKQGPRAPWRTFQNYLRDVWTVAWSPVADTELAFSTSAAEPQPIDGAAGPRSGASSDAVI